MRVWVTRDEGPDGALAAALREAGLTPVLEPVIARRAITDAREAIAQLAADDWLVLTSPFAIASVAADVARVPQVAVVGDASRAAADALGFRLALVSSGSRKQNEGQQCHYYHMDSLPHFTTLHI